VLLFGLLCGAVALGLLILLIFHNTPEVRRLLVVYVSAAAVLLGLRVLLEGAEGVREWWRGRRRSPAREAGGFALLLVLILVALLATIGLQFQVLTRLALRDSHMLSLRAELREAAAGAAWDALGRMAASESELDAGVAAEWAGTAEVSPSRIEAAVMITETNELALPPSLRGGDPVSLRLFDLRAVATRDEVSEEVRVLARRPEKGEVRVAAWVDIPAGGGLDREG
jgi:hypothetical protein